MHFLKTSFVIRFNAGFAKIIGLALKKFRSQRRFTQQMIAKLYFENNIELP